MGEVDIQDQGDVFTTFFFGNEFDLCCNFLEIPSGGTD